MFHSRSALGASLGLWMVALSGPARALCQTERASIERQYRRLDSAVERNDVTAILAFQAPTFTSINPNGAVFDYQAMEARTRLLSSLVDSVIYVRNTIRDFASHGDTVVVTVCQEFSRIQRIDGRPHRVDTSALQRERWVRVGTEWKRQRVDDVHGTRWFVDGVRVDAVRPYSPRPRPMHRTRIRQPGVGDSRTRRQVRPNKRMQLAALQV